MTITIRNLSGAVVARSKNLRGITDRCRSQTVERADLFGPNKQGGGTLGVTWSDGSTALADFQSYAVMHKWALARLAFRGVIKLAEQVKP